MPMQLDNSNFELLRELEKVNDRLSKANSKLSIALHGLNIIKDSADPMNVARATIEEIDTM